MPADIFSSVIAQPTAVETLRRALRAGRVHHAYLFDGPDGVGKERAALGLAQALLCERRAPGSDAACGACSACQRVAACLAAAGGPGAEAPRHPDLVFLERGLHAPELIGRRTREATELSIDQVRTLVLARAAYGPHEGRAKVFILRRAEELSVAAANALLKTLEEPGPSTFFVLLSAHAPSLLPTILSRTLRVRFAPLPDDVVAKLLAAQGTTPDQARAIARLARGSMAVGSALADPAESEARELFVTRAMAALTAPDMGAALDLAEEAKRTKEGLSTRILAFAAALGDRAASLVRSGNPKDAAALGGPEVLAARYSVALTAIEELEGNASPQLVVESMIARMRGAR